jgi:hypothetical protein
LLGTLRLELDSCCRRCPSPRPAAPAYIQASTPSFVPVDPHIHALSYTSHSPSVVIQVQARRKLAHAMVSTTAPSDPAWWKEATVYQGGFGRRRVGAASYTSAHQSMWIVHARPYFCAVRKNTSRRRSSQLTMCSVSSEPAPAEPCLLQRLLQRVPCSPPPSSQLPAPSSVLKQIPAGRPKAALPTRNR